MEKRQIQKLPLNRIDALRQLNIAPYRNRQIAIDESPYFVLYLNYAVNNIGEVAGFTERIFDENRIADYLKSNDAAVKKLANFFWLFNVDDPGRDYPDYANYTIGIAKKIFALRNFFAHLESSGNQPLLVDRELYVFLEGILLPQAREEALLAGLKTDKLFKLKLLIPHDKICNNYEFTRRGLIFLICLALYRDDAIEFCHLFADMKLPAKCPAKIDPEDCEAASCRKTGDEEEKTCPVAKVKAMVKMFTAFSIRRGRVLLEAGDWDFRCFADMIGYLNKVPNSSYDYLALTSEREALQAKCDASTESKENKRFKYTLHRRFRQRFLSFAAGFCEDFDFLPSLRFKRLDISENIGRKRYCFGKENDNSVRQNRHYIIRDGAIRFSFVPEKHCGPIRIGELRSSIGTSEMRRLMFALKFLDRKKVDREIAKYFTAYHQILESMLNCEDPEFYMDNHLSDFNTVAGDGITHDNFFTRLAPYFSSNLLAHFADPELPDEKDLIRRLRNRLLARKKRADDFLTRVKVWREWRNAPRDPERKTPQPHCEGLNFPPGSCRFSDGQLVAQVFRLLNLHLEPNRQFRQLPKGKQHRGEQDFEYQRVQAAIGKFNLDQKYLRKLLSQLRPELEAVTGDLLKGAQEDYGTNGCRLFGLAVSAAKLAKKLYTEERERWEDSTKGGDALYKACRRFGVRPGMPLNRESLIKSILRIDVDKWNHAFNTQEKCPHARSLADVQHVVSQIPFPNGFAARLFAGERNNKQWSEFFDPNGEFDFNSAFRSGRMKQDVALRDYYDIRPLIGYMKNHDRREGILDVTAPGVAPESASDFSATALDKAIRDIRESWNQDKLILWFSLEYWKRFAGSNSFEVNKEVIPKDASVYDYFAMPVTLAKKLDGICLRVTPNDLTRPVFAQVRRYAVEIAGILDPEKKKTEFDFYDLMTEFRRIQAADRGKRLELIPELERFMASVLITSGYTGDQEENRRMEFDCYRKKYSELTYEEYTVLANIRNEIYHNGLGLNIKPALEILKRLLPARSGSFRR